MCMHAIVRKTLGCSSMYVLLYNSHRPALHQQTKFGFEIIWKSIKFMHVFLWLRIYATLMEVSNSKYVDLGGGCNQLLLCAMCTICIHAPRHERPSEPSHFLLAWQMPLLLPINLNPVLHSYRAMLLYVVAPLTRVTVPFGWNVGGPQSTTVMGTEGEGEKGHGTVSLTSHKCTPVEVYNWITHFHKLAESHSTDH